ncbi:MULTISPECIES: M16 family metallopeptidase [Shouchella]|uniref:Zn-dependent protease n=2 Tax=Shouchella lehensis TaxID=300825 RepID=A0A060LYD0_9BACI|nr:Zn-dependent protease [Shouchella lehensis G1]RQW20633.1 insulinase family protein [Bacillus sp. C1-1]TES50652.1 insulinase family protein [Shouchella lehensis]
MINKRELSNGVRIMAEKNNTVRSVAIGIWVKTGSRNEDNEQNGISHFIEHMLFKGTKTRSPQEIAEAFDRIGGQVNAFTAKEYTCYYAKVLDEHAHIAVDVLQDMFFHSVFDEQEIEREKNVVLEEIRMVEDTPDDLVHELLSEASFGQSTLANPILGTEETLASFTREQILSYMDNYYVGERVVISVAGHYQEDLLAQLEDTFSAVPSANKQHQTRKAMFLPVQKHLQKETEQAHLCLAYPGLEVGSDQMFNLILLNNALGGSMSSRLFQEIREERGLCYSVFSYHSAYENIGSVTVYAGTQMNQLQALSESMSNVLVQLQAGGLTIKELENGKEQLKGSLMLGLESTSSRMSRNGKNELLLKKHQSLDELLNRINDISLDDVNELAHQLFKDAPALSIVSPSETMPDTIFTR